jgi:DNA-binding LacI/PurR family transcriptional regulator
MHADDNPASLLERAERIRLPIAEIARRSGLDKHTIGRLRQPTERVTHRTVKKVRDVVEAAERELRDHLARGTAA